jgi:ppGpp synthetase/RelA/SpoT-type nucleotidyltranferase
MSLPMTKGEFNRLGDRLIASEKPSQADLDSLETALAAYQDVLELAKAHLRDLGFAPTDRVKTTPTMLDKLRRTHGMELSRMQDLAGARITVHNLAAQDEAKDKLPGTDQVTTLCRVLAGLRDEDRAAALLVACPHLAGS